MTGIVNIGGKDVGMTANAASPYFYKQIFHEDFFKETQKPEVDAEIFQKMGYVMAMQSSMTTPEILKLNIENYIDWISQFDPMDILDKVVDISNIYIEQKKTTVTPKKEAV